MESVTGQRSNQLNYVPTRQIDGRENPALVRNLPLATENILTASWAAGKGGPMATEKLQLAHNTKKSKM
jgi:CDP-diacylglycerol pyrophosphatase